MHEKAAGPVGALQPAASSVQRGCTCQTEAHVHRASRPPQQTSADRKNVRQTAGKSTPKNSRREGNVQSPMSWEEEEEEEDHTRTHKLQQSERKARQRRKIKSKMCRRVGSDSV